jgi:hypothetical protein
MRESVTGLAARSLSEALISNRDIHRKWMRVFTRLVSTNDAQDLLRYQSDVDIDIWLREMEEEVANQACKEADNLIHILGFTLQHTLTRYWVLSMYEMLRVAKNSSNGKGDAKIQRLYREFQVVRVPITKLEIANDKKLPGPIKLEADNHMGGPFRLDIYFPHPRPGERKQQYHPTTLIDPLTGSLGWNIIDAENGLVRNVFRRNLSDHVLSFYDAA